MLDFLIFAITFLIFLILAVAYLYPGSKRVTTIPGPDPVDALEGNIPDIISSGSLHEFLVKIHESYGPIASFWYGQQLFVSIAKAELFQEQSAIFDRPYELFAPALCLITEHSIQVANGAEARKRYGAYAKCYTETAIRKHYDLYNQCSEDMVKRWSTWTKEEYIPLQEEVLYYAIRTILRASFGEEFVEEKLCKEVRKCYDICLAEIDAQMKGSAMEAGGPRDKRFQESKKKLFKIMEEAVERRRDVGPVEGGDKILIDSMLELNLPTQTVLADLITFFIGGFHTSGSLIAWAIYYMAVNGEVQSKARKEVLSVVKPGADITPDHANSFTYMKKVLNETLRAACVGPFAARVQDHDAVLGGHKIPAGTPVIHALGVSFYDPTIFPEPERFDPERFNEENMKSWPNFAFEPFGFAGRRKCPGYRFSLGEASVLLAHLLRNFEFVLAPDQVVIKSFLLTSKAQDEIWVTMKPLKNK